MAGPQPVLRVLRRRRRARRKCFIAAPYHLVPHPPSAQKATPSLVIAQSYQMGPSNKVDPLQMLGEAKRICDQLVRILSVAI